MQWTKLFGWLVVAGAVFLLYINVNLYVVNLPFWAPLGPIGISFFNTLWLSRHGISTLASGVLLVLGILLLRQKKGPSS